MTNGKRDILRESPVQLLIVLDLLLVLQMVMK